MKNICLIIFAILVITPISACDKAPSKPEKDAYNTASTRLAVIPKGSEHGDVVFSSDGNRVAIVVKANGKESLTINSKTGSFYDRVREPVFCKDRPGYAYIASKGGKECVVADGQEGTLYDAVDKLVYAPDGRLIYAAKRDNKWLIVTGTGESSSFDETSSAPIVSFDGKRLAYVEQHNDTKKSFLRICTIGLQQCVNGGEYDSVGAVRYNALHSHLAYPATRNGLVSLVSLDLTQSGVKEKESGWYDEVSAVDVSDNGEHIVFLAQRGGNTFLVKDGMEQPVPHYEIVFDLVVSPNGRALYTAMLQGKVLAYVDGKHIGKGYNAIHAPTFSLDGANIVYEAESGSKSVIVVNGSEGLQLDKIVTPRFTADGSRLVYRARNNNERYAVMADLHGRTIREHPHYEAVWDLTVSPDGKSLGYGVKIGQEFWWKVENL